MAWRKFVSRQCGFKQYKKKEREEWLKNVARDHGLEITISTALFFLCSSKRKNERAGSQSRMSGWSVGRFADLPLSSAWFTEWRKLTRLTLR